MGCKVYLSDLIFIYLRYYRYPANYMGMREIFVFATGLKLASDANDATKI